MAPKAVNAADKQLAVPCTLLMLSPAGTNSVAGVALTSRLGEEGGHPFEVERQDCVVGTSGVEPPADAMASLSG